MFSILSATDGPPPVRITYSIDRTTTRIAMISIGLGIAAAEWIFPEHSVSRGFASKTAVCFLIAALFRRPKVLVRGDLNLSDRTINTWPKGLVEVKGNLWLQRAKMKTPLPPLYVEKNLNLREANLTSLPPIEIGGSLELRDISIPISDL